LNPIDLILRALEAGNVPDVGVQAMIPDDYRFAYDDLLSLVAARLESVGAHTMLDAYMGEPSVWEGPLADALAEAGADTDAALIDTAQGFLSIMDTRRAARGGYTVDIDDDLEGYV
jgi:hypothetical protein